jgi:hypothetical protein
MEEQKQTLTEVFTQQVETLKAEMAAMIQTQLSNAQIPTSAPPLYAAMAYTIDKPTKHLPSLASTSRTPLNMTDTLYCTIDTSRGSEEDRNKTQPELIREAIEKEIRVGPERDNWRCTAVTRDPRNSTRIRVACKDETELQLVEEAAQKTAVPGLRVLRD